MKITCRTLEDYKSAAKELMSSFGGERIFAFYGEMGAGKTTFIKSICEYLGAEDVAKSPSFAIINEYQIKTVDSLSLMVDRTTKNEELSTKNIYHFDFYRIRKVEEAYDIGYEEYFYSGSYCLIEWPEKIEELLPDSYVRVEISINDDNSREVRAIKNNGE